MRARRGRTELQRPQAHFTDRRLALRWPQRSQTSSRALVAPTRAGSSHHRRARLIIRGSARLFDGTFTPRKANRASRDKFCGARAVEVQPFLGGRTIARHLHQRAIAYPISPGAKPGSLLTNFICQVRRQ